MTNRRAREKKKTARKSISIKLGLRHKKKGNPDNLADEKGRSLENSEVAL